MGLTTTNLESAALLDEIIGNRDGSSVRATIDAVAGQIAAAGPLASAISEKADLTAVAALEAQITTNQIVQPTWAALSALTGDLAGQGAEVLDTDTGTHADPISGGTVANAGRYSWSASPTGWRRIGPTGLSAKASRTDLSGRAAEVVADAFARQTVGRGAAPATGPDVMGLGWSVSGQTVTLIPGRSGIASAGRAIYPAGSVTLAAVATGSVTAEARTLTYMTDPRFFSAADGILDHAQVSGVVVRPAGGGAPLTDGVDYILNPLHGALGLATAGAPVDVEVDYTWSRVRYDLIQCNTTGALSVVAGTDRNRDAIEYLPRPSPGRIPLLIVRVSAAGLDVRPWRDQEAVLLSAPYLAQRARGRRLGNLHRALRAGDPITIAAYGDSRTSIGGSFAYTPNGTGRDRATTDFLEAQGADFKAAIPLFDHGDGAGQVHTHIGWNWDLKAAIERVYTNSVTYLNFGIPSTTSADTINNGLWPARLAGLTGSGAHLAVISFGTNELGAGSVDTTGNLIAIAEACLAAGIDPVIIPPGRPNATRHVNTLDDWIIEHRQCKAAADYLGIPFVDLMPITGGDTIFAHIAPQDMCGSNLYNHDSVYELGLIGRALSAVVLDL